MKRVLFVDHVNRILGGAEINLIELLGLLRAGAPQTIACACAPDGQLHAELSRLPVPLHPYTMPASLNATRFVGRTPSIMALWQSRQALADARKQLRAIAAEARPETVISCTNKDHFAAASVCRRLGIPSIWWVNDIISPEFFSLPVRAAFFWQARRKATRIVTVSEYARQVLVKAGMPPQKVSVIHNGIDARRYQGGERGAFRRQFAIPANEPLVGIVGRLTAWKGQDFFLRLAKAWAQKNAAGHFALIGGAFNEDAAFAKTLRDFTRQQGLEQRVHFIPFQKTMAATLGDLDVLIHASTRPEPFGRVIIEAMAAGVPVLAARAGGVPEIITNGVDGLLAEPGRLDDYLEQLAALLSSAELRGTLTHNARHAVQRRFSLERVGEQFKQVINDTN